MKYNIKQHLRKGAYTGLVASLASILSAADVQLRVDTTSDIINESDAVLSLREAVIKAADFPGDDVTIIIPSGHYVLTRAGLGDENGDLDVGNDNNSLTIRGDGMRVTRIDGNFTDRIFEFAISGVYTVERLTVENGHYQGLLTEARGGGIYFGSSSRITMNDVRINNCKASGLDSPAGSDVVTGTGDSSGGTGSSGATASGGGLYASINFGGTFLAQNLIIENCQAKGSDGGDGGDVTVLRASPVGGDGGEGIVARGGGAAIIGDGTLSLEN